MKQIEHRATIITARYSSSCPYCGFRVNPGEKCKVYSDEWYHPSCWEKKFATVVDDRKDKEVKQLREYADNLEVLLDNVHRSLMEIARTIEKG